MGLYIDPVLATLHGGGVVLWEGVKKKCQLLLLHLKLPKQ